MAYLYVGTTRQYVLIQDAIDAASDGDVVVVDPGTYTELLTISGAVSLRANTDDVINNPVHLYCSSTDNTEENIYITYAPTVPTELYIEGFKLTRAAVSWARLVQVAGSDQLKFYVNKCHITAGANQYCIGLANIATLEFEITNCYLDKGYNHLVNINWTATPTNGIYKTELDQTYGCQSCAGSPSTNDYVTTTTSGYGPLYGEYHIPLEVGYFDGYVFQEGSPVERTVRIYNRDDGRQLNETTSSGNGYYYLTTTYSGAHCLICLDDATGDSYNDLILGNVYPTTLSGT